MRMIIFCAWLPTINCWHKTVQQLFRHKTSHWSEITNWSDGILAVTCCNRRGAGTNLFAAARTESLWPCDGGDDWPSPWRREPRWSPSALRSSPRGTAPASAQHAVSLTLLILFSYYNPAASVSLLLTRLFHCSMWLEQEKKSSKTFTWVLSEATRATSPTESPFRSGTLRTGSVLCRPDGRGCCHLTSPAQKYCTETSLNAWSRRVVWSRKHTALLVTDLRICQELKVG